MADILAGDFGGKIQKNTVADIEAQYILLPAEGELQKQRKILEMSFASVAANGPLLGQAFEELQSAYGDALAVMSAGEVDVRERQRLLYPIYHRYFERLSLLPWKKRKTVKADAAIRKMKKCLKNSAPKNASLGYWTAFLLLALPPLAVALAGELIYLDLLGTGAPLWQTGLSLFAFIGGFTGYFYAAYHIEGRRLFGDLQRWIQYRQNPSGHNRPVSILQVLKLVVPPAITLGSAVLKIFF